MSDTAQLFILAGVWTIAAAVLVYFIPKWSVRIVVFVLAIGIPFWELPYGYFNYRKACDEQARWRAFELIPPQESLCVENLDAGLYVALIEVGFSRIEVTNGSDNYKRDQESGRVFHSNRNNIKSSYCLQHANGIKLPWGISRDDLRVIASSDQRVVGRQSQIIWTGLWWQVAAHPILGRGGMCFDDPLRGIRNVRSGTS